MSLPIDTTVNQSLVTSTEPYSSNASIKIDWFNFETRMRNLVKEMLDPCIDNQYVIEDKLKTVNGKIGKIQEQVQELEYQTTKFDIILRKLDEIENGFEMEKQAKEQDINNLQSQLLN